MSSIYLGLKQQYQLALDQATPHAPLRWLITVGLAMFYLLRVFILQGWYIITYALGIYLLNLLIGFLTPLMDPEFAENGNTDEPALPVSQNEEFKPFARRLPEFKCWLSTSRAILIAIFCSLFSFFDIPVFWPILVLYFIILFVFTLKRQILHMIKYRYIPFSHGKQHYSGAKAAPRAAAASPPAGAPTSYSPDFFARHQQPMQNAGAGAASGVGAGGSYLSSAAWSQPAPPQKLGSNLGPRPFAPLSAGPHLVHNKVAKD